MAAQTSANLPTDLIESPYNWPNEELLFLDDGSYAYADTTGQYSIPTTFNFSIPYNAKICGIEIKIEARRNPNCTISKPTGIKVSLTGDGGTNWSNEKICLPATTSWTVYTLGDSGDRWGYIPSWSPNNFNDPALFAVKLYADLGGTWSCFPGGPEWQIDYLTATIHFITPDSPFIQSQISRSNLSPGGV